MIDCLFEDTLAQVFIHFDIGKTLDGSTKSEREIAQHATAVLPIRHRWSHFHRSLHILVIHNGDDANTRPSASCCFFSENEEQSSRIRQILHERIEICSRFF